MTFLTGGVIDHNDDAEFPRGALSLHGHVNVELINSHSELRPDPSETGEK
ncbi:hypothetical protein [Veronia nyctiphanis]|nr:hypothetical protein [Veronia nyctiphanis]